MKSDTMQIDFSTMTLDRMKTFQLVYHDDEDVLFIRSEPAQAATSFDLEGDIWIRFAPETGEIVGLEIEDFEGIFLKKYPQIAPAWAEAKRLCRHKNKKKEADLTWESFLLILVNFFLAFLKKNPQQAELDIAAMQAQA